jgi:hypothetical protein
MYRDHQPMSPWVLTALALGCLACTSGETKSGDAETAQGDTAVAAAETEQAPATPSGGAVASEAVNAPLAVEDIERWERGQRAEIEEVDKRWAKLKDAKSAMDTMSVQLSVAEEQSVNEVGARAAGVSVDRYQQIDNMIMRVLGARMSADLMQQGRDAMKKSRAEIDTTKLTPEQRAEVRRMYAQADSAVEDPYKDLAPDVAAVFQRRAAQLDTLRWSLVAAIMGKALRPGAKP